MIPFKKLGEYRPFSILEVINYLNNKKTELIKLYEI